MHQCLNLLGSDRDDKRHRLRPNSYLAKDHMSALSILLNLLWIVFGGLEMAIGLGCRRSHYGNHNCWPALGPSGIQHRRLHPASLRSESGFSSGTFRYRGYRHRTIWDSWQYHMAGARGLVASAGAPHHPILLAISIIGIPFAWAHLKLAGMALWPIGKMIVAADAPLQYRRQR